MMGSKFPHQFERSAALPDWLPVEALRAHVLSDLLCVPGVEAKEFNGVIAFKTRPAWRKWREELRWPIVSAGTIRFSEEKRRVTMTFDIARELWTILLGSVLMSVQLLIFGKSPAFAVVFLPISLALAWICVPNAAQRYLDRLVSLPPI